LRVCGRSYPLIARTDCSRTDTASAIPHCGKHWASFAVTDAVETRGNADTDATTHVNFRAHGYSDAVPYTVTDAHFVTYADPHPSATASHGRRLLHVTFLVTGLSAGAFYRSTGS
jgi:hypothetical protein